MGQQELPHLSPRSKDHPLLAGLTLKGIRPGGGVLKGGFLQVYARAKGEQRVASLEENSWKELPTAALQGAAAGLLGWRLP